MVGGAWVIHLDLIGLWKVTGDWGRGLMIWAKIKVISELEKVDSCVFQALHSFSNIITNWTELNQHWTDLSCIMAPLSSVWLLYSWNWFHMMHFATLTFITVKQLWNSLYCIKHYVHVTLWKAGTANCLF